MRLSRLSQTVAVALLASALVSPTFATEYYTVNAPAPHWWSNAGRNTKRAVSNAFRTITGRGNGQWTATTQYPDGSTKTTTGGN